MKTKIKSHKEIMEEKTEESRKKFDLHMKGSLFSDFDKIQDKKPHGKKEINNADLS